MLNQNEIDELVILRQALHQSPELSGEEIQTSKKIHKFLSKFSPTKIIHNLSGAAIVAVYEGVDTNGPTILFRCELDALPILEQNSENYKSATEGVAHSCGHDGHMSIIASIAMILSRKPLAKGRVILVFQPAEETGQGARPLVVALKNHELVPDYSFALHNMPKMKMHEIGIKSGTFNCASVGMKIQLFGKTSHASHPENGLSPSDAVCEILSEIKNINRSYKDADNYTAISLTHVNMGEESFGITVGQAVVLLTLRSETDLNLEAIKQRLETFVADVCFKYDLKFTYNYEEYFAASVNDVQATDQIIQACNDEGQIIVNMNAAWRASEDFGLYGDFSRSAMFLLGSGVNRPQLHNPNFDFPDELIATGNRIFMRMIHNILG